MSEIGTIIDQKEIDKIISTDKAVTSLDEQMKVFVSTIGQLSEALKKDGISFKELNDAQKKTEKTVKSLNEINKKQLSAEQALEKQRQKALSSIEKSGRATAKNIGRESLYFKELKKTTAQLQKEEKAEIRKAAATKRAGLATARSVGREGEYFKQLRRTESQLKRNASQTKNITTALKSFGGQLLGFLGITAGIAVLKSLGTEILNLSIRLEGDSRRANIVFGQSLGYVTEQAIKLSKSLGLTKNEFIAAAAGTADLLIPLDFSRESAAQMSVELQKMSGALSEWTGGRFDAQEVSVILTKAMLGENEQLKTLGIAIRKDSEEFRDLVKVKLETVGVTKAQAEAMATLELIQKKSLDAQTAFNMEGNKLLRLQRDISRQWREMKENIVTYFDVNAQEKIIKEQSSLNSLVGAITNANASQEARNTLIDELSGKYPDFLGDLDTEKVTNEQLRDRLKEVNDQYEERIRLLVAKEIQEAAVGELAESFREEERVLKRIAFLEKEIAEGRRFTEGDVNAQIDYNDVLKVANIQLENVQKNREELNKRVQDAIDLVIELGGEEDKQGSKTIKTTEEIEAIRQKTAELFFTNQQKELAAIDKKAIELRKSGIAEIDIAKWVFNEKAKINGKYLAELEKDKQEEIDLEQNVADTIDQLTEELFADADAQGKKELENLKKRLDKEEQLINDSNKQKHDDSIEAQKELEAAKIDLIRGGIESAFSIYESFLERQIMANEEKLETDLERNDSQREQELAKYEGNKEQQALINEKYDDLEKGLRDKSAREKAALQRKQAVAQKAAAVTTAVTNAALAILSAYTTPPAPVGIALGLVMGGLAAVQIAAILAQPIPKFFKGTDNVPTDGVISVSEKGGELIEKKTGEMLYAPKQTYLSGMKGAKIYTHEQTKEIIGKGAGYDSIDLREVVESNNRIEKAIKNIPRATYNKDYRKITERKGNYNHNYLNRKLGG